jgi:hypothetical protein
MNKEVSSWFNSLLTRLFLLDWFVSSTMGIVIALDGLGWLIVKLITR